MYLVEMTQEKAYMLGFLAADGWISRNSLGFALKRSDKAMVERFAGILSVETGKSIIVHDYESKCSNGKYYPASRFTVTDTLLTKRLAEFGIIQRKSYIDINYLDYIPDEYKMTWVFGLFDGDGGITLITDDRHRNSALVHFTGRKDFLIQLGDYLEYRGSIRETKTEASVLKFANKQYVIDFLSKYIDFAEQVQVLERKLAKANEALEIMLHNDKYCSGTDKIYTATCEVSANAIKKRAVNWGIYESKGSSASVDEVKIMKVFLKELNVKNTAKICEVSEWSVSNKLSKFDSRYKQLLVKGDIIKDDLGHYYESLEIAANALGDSSYTRHIQENLKGLRLTAYGRVFTYGAQQEYIEYLLDASNNSERAIVYRDIYNSIYSENIKESLSDMP